MVVFGVTRSGVMLLWRKRRIWSWSTCVVTSAVVLMAFSIRLLWEISCSWRWSRPRSMSSRLRLMGTRTLAGPMVASTIAATTSSAAARRCVFALALARSRFWGATVSLNSQASRRLAVIIIGAWSVLASSHFKFSFKWNCCCGAGLSISLIEQI